MNDCKRSEGWFITTGSVWTVGVFWFEKVLTGVWGWGTGVMIGEGTIVFVIEFVFVGVTLGDGVGADKEGVVFVRVGGGLGFLIGTVVAIATGREGWVGIVEWLVIVNPCPIVTVDAATACWWTAPKKSSFQYRLTTYFYS